MECVQSDGTQVLMPSVIRTVHGRASVLAALACLGAGSAGAAAQDVRIRARVVDEEQRSPVQGAEVLLLTEDSIRLARAVTGEDGFFELTADRSEPVLLSIRHLAFEPLTARITPGDGEPLPAFVLRPVVIPVEGIEVRVDRDDPEDPESVPAIERSVGRSAHVLAGSRLANLEEVGASFEAAVRQLGAGVRVRSMGSLTCVQAGRLGGGGGCNMVAIVVDGVNTGLRDRAAMLYLRSLDLLQFESIQYLSPMEAGFRYGLDAGERGALVLWTRGFGPYASGAREGGG